MTRTGWYDGNERWQGTVELSLLKMAINMANADYLSFFSMERTGAPLPTAGSLELLKMASW